MLKSGALLPCVFMSADATRPIGAHRIHPARTAGARTWRASRSRLDGAIRRILGVNRFGEGQAAVQARTIFRCGGASGCG